MTVLWVGHEADCYTLENGNNVETTTVVDAGYERVGVQANLGSSGSITSSPDWAAQDEIWHRFLFSAQAAAITGAVVWAAKNAAGQIVAQIVCATNNTFEFKYQVWNGATFTDVGPTFVGSNAIYRIDIHHKGGASGAVEVWFGNPGTQAKVVDATGNYSSAVGIVRIYHAYRNTSVFKQNVSHSIVQTVSTLSSTSETKPPTSNGTDVGGTGTWAAVDEQVYSDADVVTFSAAGQRQSFKAAARTLTQAVVTGVTASCRAWYESGGPSHLKPYLTIGGTRYYGTTFALGLTASAYQYTWNTNPATGVRFTAAEANAATLEWGWEAA